MNTLRLCFSIYYTPVTSLIAQLVKNPPAMRETWVLIPGLGKSTGEGTGYPLQYSGLENSMDCIGHGTAKSWTQQVRPRGRGTQSVAVTTERDERNSWDEEIQQ